MATPAPLRGNPEILQRNLFELARADASLHRRLSLPVEGDPVVLDPDGEPRYRIHRSLHPFVMSPGEVSRSVAEVAAASHVQVFGAGLGEQVAHLLSTRPEVSVLAWDRDPRMMRLLLSRRAFGPSIRDGRLRLALGVDLIDRIADPSPGGAWLRHPFFARLYRHEIRLLERGVGERRAILGLGGLFVDDLGDELSAAGYSVLPADFRNWAEDELHETVRRFDPELLATINYLDGLAEFAHEADRRLLVWEIDPATSRVSPVRSPTDRAYVFTYRRGNVTDFRAAGFEHVEALPLASNPRERHPVELNDEQRARYAAPVSFVGSSMVEQAQRHARTFLSLYAAWHPDGIEALGPCQETLAQILERQRQRPDLDLVASLVQERFGAFLDGVRAAATPEDPLRLVAEIAAAEKRLAYVEALGEFGVHVWGDDGWRNIDAAGVDYRGPADHSAEITRIYNASTINVDINRLYQRDIVTMRTFDVLACGGFLIAEHGADLAELFELGVEVESFSTLEELRGKIAHYLAHPEAAREIARRGLEAVRSRHTIGARLAYMLERTLA